MPYPNEHACRLNPPGKYGRYTSEERKSKATGKIYRVLFGWFKKGKDEVSEEQAYRYPKGKWSASEASTHCRKHNGSFEAAEKVQEFSDKYGLE